MMNLALKTEGISKKYGKQEVVSNVSITLNRGDIYGFVGPNGAGKSTVLKMIAGLIKPNQGSVDNFGNTISAVIEIPNFYSNMTGRENLKCIALHYGDYALKKVDEVLELTELTEAANKKVGLYSLGMKQRLAIARTFISNPDIIILDEPTNGLDPYGIKTIRELIIKLTKFYGKTFLISSHILSELELVCNKFGIINRGKLIEEKSLVELKEKIGDGVSFEDYFIKSTKEEKRYV